MEHGHYYIGVLTLLAPHFLGPMFILGSFMLPYIF